MSHVGKSETGWLARLTRPVDLTTGTPWRVILRYATPIILSCLLQQVYVLTDSIICGQVLTSGQVAGVNDTFPLTFIFLQFAFGCTAGFSVVTAKCVGNGDNRGVRQSFATQVVLSVGISLILTVLSLLLLPSMLMLINVTPDNPEVYAAAYDYCFVIFIGILAQMGYNFICSILRARGDSVTPLLFLGISTALNIALDLFFLIPLRMGPAGAAIATVLAQFLSVIFCCIYTFSKYKELRLHREDWKITVRGIADHLRNGLPMGTQLSILAIGIIVMQGAVVSFDLTESGVMVPGTPAQNGFGAATKLINFLMSAYSGLGSAILGYNAQNYGRGDHDRVRRGFLQTLLIMLVIFAICLTVGLLLSIGGAYQYIFMSADKVSEASITYGNIYIYVDLFTYAILGFLFVSRSGTQGVMHPEYVLIAGVSELVARVLICYFLPAAVEGHAIAAGASNLAFATLCAGDPGAWLAASLVLLIPTFKYMVNKE